MVMHLYDSLASTPLDKKINSICGKLKNITVEEIFKRSRTDTKLCKNCDIAVNNRLVRKQKVYKWIDLIKGYE